MALLNQVLKTAKKYGLIFHEIPTSNISPIPITKKHIDFWTKDEFQKVTVHPQLLFYCLF